MKQMERRLLELYFNGNPWNDRSFLLAELFWQSLVQQMCGTCIVAYFFSKWQYKRTCFGCYCTCTFTQWLIFSLNDNTNALVLVVIVHLPSSCHATPGHELNVKYETLHMVRLLWGYWLYINMYKWQLLLFFFTILTGLSMLILFVIFCRQYSRETSIKKNRSCQSYRRFQTCP